MNVRLVEQTVSALRSYGVARTCTLIWRSIAKDNVPWSERLWLLRHGYKPISYVIYDFANKTKSDRKFYLSDIGRRRLATVNAESGRFLRNKLVFHRIMERVSGIRTAKLLAFVRRGEIIRASAPNDVMPVDDLDEDFFLKPVGSGKGSGVQRVSGGDLEPLLRVLTHRGNENLIVKTVEQASYSRHIFPGAFNTVRAVTMRAPSTREVFIPYAVHRFGSTETVPLDNWSKGGLSCEIDVESGIMGAGIRHASCTNGRLVKYPQHPDTGADLAGIAIPNWQGALRVLTELMNIFPDIEFSGWDLLATDDGWCVIEGNDMMDIDLLQVHRGLLVDHRAREFVAHHCPGVVN